MVTPAVKHKIVKKRTKQFIRFHGDRYDRIGYKKWRHPRGIDNPMRRRFRGQAPMAKIGYGTNKKHRHILPNGFLKVRIFNVKELEMLLMQNRRYAAEIAGTVSVRGRKAIIERAQQLDIKVLNAGARLRTEEVGWRAGLARVVLAAAAPPCSCACARAHTSCAPLCRTPPPLSERVCHNEEAETRFERGVAKERTLCARDFYKRAL